jgi:hypothetical protein
MVGVLLIMSALLRIVGDWLDVVQLLLCILLDGSLSPCFTIFLNTVRRAAAFRGSHTFRV